MAYTTIKKPSDYFNTKLYTGNGSTQSITGVGFQPDFLWFKNRDETQWHQIYDVIRGIGSTSYYLSSNTTNAEASTTNSLTGVSSDGFSLGNNTGVNGSADNIVAWNWLAGGTGSSNTDGSITSTVSANTTSGFSIVKWSGNGTLPSTIGHGLGVAPKMIIVKQITANTYSWLVYHQEIGNTYYLALNTTDAKDNSVNLWGNTSPTSSVFTVNHVATNASGVDYIAYCFADVQGFSKFGSYVGNGSADGTFVYTGFKPAFILIKNASNGSENWEMFDTKRDTFNSSYKGLLPNTSGTELTNTAQSMDILSNGFKPRAAEYRFNEPNATIIYMAFAEEPLVGDNPATAR